MTVCPAVAAVVVRLAASKSGCPLGVYKRNHWDCMTAELLKAIYLVVRNLSYGSEAVGRGGGGSKGTS